MLHTGQKLRDYKLSAQEEEIGNVEDLYFDDRFWTIRYLVADAGGWLTGRLVLISPHAVVSVDADQELVTTNLTKRQIEEGPSPDADPPVSRQFEISYHGYYGYSPYWVGPYAWGAFAQPLSIPEKLRDEEQPSWDSHLFSTVEMTGTLGYRVEATDDEMGHIADIVVDDYDWAIRYLVVDTRNWWPGKHVLIAPQWLRAVDWASQAVAVDLTRDTIKEAPEYDDDRPISREYEEELHRYYQRQGYWSERDRGAS